MAGVPRLALSVHRDVAVWSGGAVHAAIDIWFSSAAHIWRELIGRFSALRPIVLVGQSITGIMA